MKYYAVIDTNVLVSALITKKEGVATKRIWDYVLDGTIVPLFNSEDLSPLQDAVLRMLTRTPSIAGAHRPSPIIIHSGEEVKKLERLKSCSCPYNILPLSKKVSRRILFCRGVSFSQKRIKLSC